MRVIDGGSRWGGESHWAAYHDVVEVLAFEPDAEECRRLNETPQSAKNYTQRHLPVALGRGKGRTKLHLARLPDSSSLLKNDDRFLSRFGMAHYVEQVGEVEVDTTSVDALLAERGWEYLDFMKLDVEGAELDVLEGARRTLSQSLLGLSVEVWFQREHLGRPLFTEIDTLLREFGFVLFDLRELNRWRRKPLCGRTYESWIGAGQLMYANALYFRDLPAQLERAGQPRSSTRGMALKLASLAEVYCYPDFAIEVLDAAGSVGALGKGEVEELTGLLARHATQPTSDGGRRLARRTARALLPPAVRRRIMRLLQSLVTEG